MVFRVPFVDFCGARGGIWDWISPSPNKDWAGGLPKTHTWAFLSQVMDGLYTFILESPMNKLNKWMMTGGVSLFFRTPSIYQWNYRDYQSRSRQMEQHNNAVGVYMRVDHDGWSSSSSSAPAQSYRGEAFVCRYGRCSRSPTPKSTHHICFTHLSFFFSPMFFFLFAGMFIIFLSKTLPRVWRGCVSAAGQMLPPLDR